MTDFLVRRIAHQPQGEMARIALGMGVAALALGIRLSLAPLIGMGAPFGAFVLAVLVATIFGGVLSALTCVALLSAGGLVMLAPFDGPVAARRALLSVAFFAANSGLAIWLTTLLRAALSREVSARQRERLLQLELQHRVKNTLAVIQSLAHQTFRDVPDAASARRRFEDRLVALSGAHNLLVSTGWRPVTLDALADQAVAPFRPADPDRMRLEGGPVPVEPEAAVALALCLHELATNAAKYGALSGDAGEVRLTWRVADADGGSRRLELDWRESGGPEPQSARRPGFGARLLTRALAALPGARVELVFPSEGARWRAAFEL